MNEFAVKLRIWLRAELTLFKADAQRRTHQALLATIALGCMFVALLFGNVGIFFMLTEAAAESRAAFILAGCNLALALIPFLMRKQAKPGAEEQMIRDIREMAIEEITRDANEIANTVSSFSRSIKQLKSSFGASHGLGPALGLAIDLLKKSKGKK